MGHTLVGNHFKKRKHIPLATFFVNDVVSDGHAQPRQVKSDLNDADMYTKVLKTPKECRDKYSRVSTFAQPHRRPPPSL